MEPITLKSQCASCGQGVGFGDFGDSAPLRCSSCVAREREPQGEAVRLFTPAPAVMAGQLDMGS